MSLFSNSPADDSKKRKRSHHLDDIDMVYYPSTSSTMSLQPPPAPSRKLSQRVARPRDAMDEFLSSDLDLELSFASTVSLNSPPASPPRESTVHAFLRAGSSPVPMDISPAPQTHANSIFGAKNASKPKTRPRAYTVRAFGSELGNQASAAPNASFKSGSSSQSASKRLQRAALPLEWMSQLSQPKVFTDSSSIHDCVCDISITADCPTFLD